MTKQLYVLMGKSLSGKTYIENKLHTYIPQITKIITNTTRPKRQGEHDGIDYYFVTKNAYKQDIDTHNALAVRTYNVINKNKSDTWIYYLNKNQLNNINNGILILDLKGYVDLQKELSNENIKVTGLYLDIPLKSRLKRYLTTPRKKESEKEFVRRLYDDELNAFNDINNTDFCKEHNIVKVKTIKDIMIIINKQR